MPNLTGQSLGRYHLLEKLGEGGMATVYKAYDTRLERDVAVKIIRTDQFAPAVLDRILKRFDREAKALARLTHPNVVRVYGARSVAGRIGIWMELIQGSTLEEILQTQGSLSAGEARGGPKRLRGARCGAQSRPAPSGHQGRQRHAGGGRPLRADGLRRRRGGFGERRRGRDLRHPGLYGAGGSARRDFDHRLRRL